MEFFNSQQLQIILQLILAALLGGLIGFQRKHVGKPAGMRTYALVCLGAALFTILSTLAFQSFTQSPGFDPSRVAANIVVGIGFLGAGVIIFRTGKVQGLTTAAGLWVAAAIGMAVGVRFYLAAIFTALFAFFILSAFGKLEDVLIARWEKEEKEKHEK